MGSVVDTYLLTNQDLEEIYARFLLGLFLLLPSFALTRGTFTYSRNYWVRQLCDSDVVLTACALGRVDQCCRGKPFCCGNIAIRNTHSRTVVRSLKGHTKHARLYTCPCQ